MNIENIKAELEEAEKRAQEAWQELQMIKATAEAKWYAARERRNKLQAAVEIMEEKYANK